MGKITNFRLNSIAFGSILLIGAFNACQFASLGQVMPDEVGKPRTVPGGPRFVQPTPDGVGQPRTVPGGPRFVQPAEDLDRLSPIPAVRSLRGSCDIKGQLNLTALVPQNKVARTVSDYPTFFFYLPKTEAKSAEFMLLDKSGKPIYQQTLTISNLSGVIGISIPANKNVNPLKVGESYRWSLTVICDSEDRSIDLTELGTVRRVELSADIRSQLEKANPRQKTVIYAENGIWQDALSNVAAALRAQPNDQDIKNDWESLLDSVTLSKIAKEPIVQNEPQP